MSFLPSKKFTIIMLFILYVGGAAYSLFFINDYFKQKSEDMLYVEATGKINAINSSSDFIKSDKDKDGVSDFDESLLGLDPENSNSSEGSQTDKEMLEQKRKEKQEKFGDLLMLLETKKETTTSKISKSIYTSIETQGSTQSIDAEALSTSIQNSLITPDFYVDIQNINQAETKESFRKNMARYLNSNALSPLEIKGYFDEIQDDSKKNIYTSALLLKLEKSQIFLTVIPVPESQKEIIINHLNTLYKTQKSIERIKNQNEDPLPAYQAVQDFPDLVTRLYIQYEEIAVQ